MSYLVIKLSRVILPSMSSSLLSVLQCNDYTLRQSEPMLVISQLHPREPRHRLAQGKDLIAVPV